MSACCSKFCDGYDYRGSVSSGGSGARRTCDYILITGHRRGCPAGHGCTKKRVNGAPILRGYAERMDQEARAVKRKEKATWA